MTAPASEPGRLYAVEQQGVVRVVEGGKVRAQPFLDIHSQVSFGGERGLLSIAFHPLYARNHLFYVDFTDQNGDSRVVEYRSNGRAAIPSSARQLFFERQPFPNHNGGQLAFGPDGLLYIGLGDGGSGGDPNNNGQTMTTKLAKIWKLDVRKRRRAAAARRLRPPQSRGASRSTGRTATSTSATWARARGRRSTTCRARSSATLANFGWAVYEGRARVRPDADAGHARAARRGRSRSTATTTAARSPAASSTAGRPADLAGRYFYGDYCSGIVWSLRIRSGRATGLRREAYKLPGLTSFGEDARGGLYAVTGAA